MRVLCIILFSLYIANVGCIVSTNDGLEDILLKILQGLEDVKKQLNSLQAAFEQKTTSLSNGCSISDITEAIIARKFELAEEQMKELPDKRKITQIVHVVYASASVNTDIILDFVKNLKDCDTKFRVFSALHKEMRTSGNSDPFKLINLVEIMTSALAKEQSPSAYIKTEAQGEIQGAIESVKDTSANFLKMAMINGRYQNSAEVEGLTTAIFNFRVDVSDEVVESVVDSVFGVVATKKILDNISSHRHTQQVIAGLMAIFNRFNYAGNLNNDAIIDLAKHLRDLRQRYDYTFIDQKLKNEVDGIIDRLPACARSLYFNTNNCLWNKGKGAYMYAGSSEHKHDKDRRNLFTGNRGNIVKGAAWHIEKIGDYYFFKNVDYANEYLYTVDGNPREDNETRFLFNWIPGYNTDAQSRFSIELDGNHCYIKSAYYNEYLFASSVKYNKLNSYVSTWVGPTIVRSADFQWELRNCDRGGNY